MNLLNLATEGTLKFQTIDASIPIATAAGTLLEFKTNLDQAYDKIIAIGVFEITNGDQGFNYEVGAKTKRTQWIDPINIGAWLATTGVGPNDKFFETNIPFAAGDPFFMQIIPGLVVATDALAVQMVLVLQRTLTEMPKV